MMQTDRIMTPSYNMVSQLQILWKISFGDNQGEIRFFFNNAFQKKNCLVYCVNEKVVSALYLLPIKILVGEEYLQAHYIYAASTLPEFRGKGYMGALLRAAAKYGEKRGDCASVLLPAENSLYDYYCRYEYRKYFQVKNKTLTRWELLAIAGRTKAEKVIFSGMDMNNIRTESLKRSGGSVFWDNRSVQFAASFHQRLGGKVISTFGGYLLCSEQDDSCIIQEIFCEPSRLPVLLANLLQEVNAHLFCFRVPADDILFSQTSIRPEPFGMLRPLGSLTWTELTTGFLHPYLGLTMDG